MLKPQNLLHKWQKLTKAQHQLTINTKEKSLSDKSNYSRSEASECLETTSVMNQSTCILVAVATKSLRARWKLSDRHEQKHLHTDREKWNTKTVCRIEAYQRSAAEKQNDYLTRGGIIFWILICAVSLLYHLSSQKSKERELGSSTKVTV